MKCESIRKVIEDNLDYLVRFAYYLLNNLTEAEDIVYEAVLRLLEKDVVKIRSESLRLYLFRIVYNLCMDNARCKDKELVSIDSIDIEDSNDAVLGLEESDRINACLDGLPQREADVIRMNVVDGLSFVEIGSILSIPQSTAKSRYKSGMDKLRKRFNNDKMS